MEIGEIIRNKRKSAGKTLEEVSKVVGVSKQTIQRYESGEIKHIPYDKLVLVAKALNCNGSEFFTLTIEPEPTSDEMILLKMLQEERLKKLITSYMELSDIDKNVVEMMIESLSKKK